MTGVKGGTKPESFYEESRWRYIARRYSMLAVLGVFLVAMLVLVIAILTDYFLGFPDLGARSSNVQSWAVLGGVGGGGIVFLAYTLATEVRLTRRASIGVDELVLGRGIDGRQIWSPLGSSPGPARIAVQTVRRFRLETFEPMRTFPTYRQYRAWRAQFDLLDGRVVPLDPSVDGFYPPAALEALIRLASHLKDRGVEVDVQEGGSFHMWKLDRKRSL